MFPITQWKYFSDTDMDLLVFGNKHACQDLGKKGEQKEKGKKGKGEVLYNIEWIFQIFHDAIYNGTIELEITALYDV